MFTFERRRAGDSQFHMNLAAEAWRSHNHKFIALAVMRAGKEKKDEDQ
jgi:hypothetical protein